MAISTLTYNFTFFFTFVCNDEIRRTYIEIAIKTLFERCKDIEVPVLVVDGSNGNELEKNRNVFKHIRNITYIEDNENNPFKRCKKYLNLIKTPYVLRLLEDAAFINFSKNDFSAIKKDINILNNKPNIDVIHYLMVDDKSYTFNEI